MDDEIVSAFDLLGDDIEKDGACRGSVLQDAMDIVALKQTVSDGVMLSANHPSDCLTANCALTMSPGSITERTCRPFGIATERLAQPLQRNAVSSFRLPA